MSKINSQIIGTGFYVPNNVIKNQYFTNFMDTSDEWIRTRTGIEERRFVNDQSGPSDLALQASEMALNNAHMSSKDIDFIIFATSTPDYYVPGSGCLLQDKMDCNDIGALDIRTQCSGFIYGLSIADQYIKSGMYSKILVVGAEVQSTAMDLSSDGRDTCIIFADVSSGA